MKKVLFVSFTLFVAFLLASCTLILEDPVTTNYMLELPVQQELTIDNSINGYVTLIQSDTPSISVEEYALGSDVLSMEEVLDDIYVEVTEEDSRVRIAATGPTTLPPSVMSIGVNIVVRTTITTNNVVIKTNNDNIQVQNFSGILEATTSNGNISIMNATGELQLYSSNGSVDINDFGGSSLSIDTSNGSVLVDTSRNIGTANIKTSNGEINFISEAHLNNSTYNFITSNNDVKIQLPYDSGFNVEATTSNGQIYCQFTNFLTTDGSYLDTIKSGGADITLETTNGNIDILAL